LVDILTFDGFFDAKFDILKPRWLPTPGQRGVHRRFESAQRLVAGHGSLGQVLGEVRASRHGVGEVANVRADERALFAPVLQAG